MKQGVSAVYSRQVAETDHERCDNTLAQVAVKIERSPRYELREGQVRSHGHQEISGQTGRVGSKQVDQTKVDDGGTCKHHTTTKIDDREPLAHEIQGVSENDDCEERSDPWPDGLNKTLAVEEFEGNVPKRLDKTVCVHDTAKKVSCQGSNYYGNVSKVLENVLDGERNVVTRFSSVELELSDNEESLVVCEEPVSFWEVWNDKEKNECHEHSDGALDSKKPAPCRPQMKVLRDTVQHQVVENEGERGGQEHDQKTFLRLRTLIIVRDNIVYRTIAP